MPIVVIGASQGGVRALRNIVKLLPKDFPAPIFIVLHVGSHDSILPTLLMEFHGLLATHAQDGEEIRPGHVFVAPPDRHLLIGEGKMKLSRGPRENWARPAIDPLFRTAAESYGPDVIGVVLTGRLNDGTAGLYEIKQRGGIAIVQTPEDAEAPSMPQSALDNVSVDFCVPHMEIPSLLMKLVKQPDLQQRSAGGGQVVDETEIVNPTAQTCPECGGAFEKQMLGRLERYRCHIGHIMTAEVLAATQLVSLENDISAILRRLNERRGLCEELALRHERKGDGTAPLWRKAAEETANREQAIQKFVETDWIRPENAPENIG